MKIRLYRFPGVPATQFSAQFGPTPVTAGSDENAERLEVAFERSPHVVEAHPFLDHCGIPRPEIDGHLQVAVEIQVFEAGVLPHRPGLIFSPRTYIGVAVPWSAPPL